MTQEQKNEIRRYEIKIEDVKSRLEIAVNELAGVFEKRDAAIYARNKSVEEKDKAKSYIESVKKEISDLDESLSRKKKEYNDFSDSRSSSRESLNIEIKGLEDKKNLLLIEVDELSIKYDRYVKLIEGYNDIIKNIEIGTDKLVSINNEILIANKNLEKSKKEAEIILKEASDTKDKNDKEFAILSEYRAGLDFYAERIRNWYHDKGLKLPEEYEVENINKPI